MTAPRRFRIAFALREPNSMSTPAGPAWRALRSALFRIDAETVHHLAMNAFSAVATGPIEPLVRARWGRSHPSLATRVFGIDFPGPVGLAAGFDKDARWFPALAALGFDFIEVGTLTAHPQAGNPRPRLFRLPRDRALLNRMGFNNGGSAAASERLARSAGMCGDTVIAANIGRSKIVSNEEADADYLTSFERLWPHVSYITVNVSSPNTPGLRALQERPRLESLLRRLQERGRALAAEAGRDPKPLLVKIDPDQTLERVDAVVDLCLDIELDGIIATNTTVRRDGLRTSDAVVESLGAGGISGEPLRKRSRAVVSHIYRRSEGSLPIVGVGGISTADDAWAMLRAGASLVQAYTGFVYGGPAFVERLHRGLHERLAQSDAVRLDEIVGADA